jgi:hypothetical protein
VPGFYDAPSTKRMPIGSLVVLRSGALTPLLFRLLSATWLQRRESLGGPDRCQLRRRMLTDIQRTRTMGDLAAHGISGSQPLFYRPFCTPRRGWWASGQERSTSGRRRRSCQRG